MFVPRVQYPGLRAYHGATYTRSHGTTPGQIQIRVGANFGTLEPKGDCVLSNGDVSILIPDCKVIDLGSERTTGTQGGIITLYDHLWRWITPVVSGRYNVIADKTVTVPLIAQPPGNPDLPPPGDPAHQEAIDPRTKKTARELARLCLEALNEKHYDLTALDDSQTPTVVWDLTPAREALNHLAESQGLRVVWQPIARKVLLAKLGEGAELPTDYTTGSSPSLSVKLKPQEIICYYAPARYQQRWRAEWVMPEFDGSYRKPDDVSYKPVKGWAAHGPGPFSKNIFPKPVALPGHYTQEDAKALADKCAYRTYRLVNKNANGDGPLYVPPDSHDSADKKEIWQILLLHQRNQTTVDSLGRAATLGGIAYGVHEEKKLKGAAFPRVRTKDTHATTEVHIPFDIDQKKQLIIFHRRLYKKGDDRKIKPVDVVIECAAEILDNDTHQKIRESRQRSLAGGESIEPAIIRHEELIATFTATYKEFTVDRHEFDKIEKNTKELAKLADYYLKGEELKYDVEGSQSVTYGLLRDDIDLDGAIRQITYNVGDSDPADNYTQVSRNTEHHIWLPNYGGRRQIEQSIITTAAVAAKQSEDQRQADLNNERAARFME